jgi:hypothetical protein
MSKRNQIDNEQVRVVFVLTKTSPTYRHKQAIEGIKERKKTTV